jgi:hypothetical protein
MEDAIHDAENKLKMAQASFTTHLCRRPVQTGRVTKAVDAGQDKVDRLFKRWEELEAKKKAGESSSLS